MDIVFCDSGRANDEASGAYDEERAYDENFRANDEKGDPDGEEKASGKKSVEAKDVEENTIRHRLSFSFASFAIFA